MTMKGQRKYSILWVDPEFHMLMKSEAAKHRMPIVDFTSKLVREKKSEESSVDDSKKNMKRGFWDFGF